MASDAATVTVSKKRVWAGRVLTALPALLLLFSGAIKLMKPAEVVEEFTRLGYPESIIIGIGVLEIVCTLVYLIPRTSVLGAILLAAYLGGATATHVRVGDPFYGPVVIGIVLWAGLYLRDERLGNLLPLRREPQKVATSAE